MALPRVIMTENRVKRQNEVLMAYNITVKNEDETEIEIYDVIRNQKSKNYWTGEEGTEVTPKDIQDQIKAITTSNIVIRMNSGGGEVNAANTIAVAIQEARQDGKKVVCKIVGTCASAAVQIALACEEVIIHKSALMMIHNPMSFMYGYYNVNDLGPVINALTAVKKGIMNYYTDKTGMAEEEISAMMDEEKYMDGKEAVELGFADSLMFEDEEETEEEVINRVNQTVNMNNDFMRIPERYQYGALNIISNPTKKEETEVEIKTVNDLRATYPELVNEAIAGAVAEAKEQAVNEERARMKAIDEMAGTVKPEVLNEAKYETFASAETVALDAIKSGAFIQNNVLNAMQTETQDANGVAGVPNGGNAEPVVDEKKKETQHAENVAEKYFKSIGKK